MDIKSSNTNTLAEGLCERHFSMFDETASKTVHKVQDRDR